MEVIIKSSPNIEVELATRVVRVGDGGSIEVDSSLSTTSENPVQNKVVTEELGKKVNKEDVATINGKSLTEGGNIVIEGGGAVEITTPDWSASKGESGFIKSRTHYVSGTRPIPFENWNKSIDENGDAIYSFFVGYDECYGCIIRDVKYGVEGENYIFFETEWVSLSPAILADIRLNIDIESSDTLLEIKLYKDGDGEDYLKTFINNTLFATGQWDFTARIAENFIPNTIARQDSVNELREETTALWENLDSGTFPNLTAGDLAGRGESVPASFGFRASGGKSIKDGRAYIKRIKGNSVVWNNMVDTRALQGQSGWTYESEHLHLVKGHKYAFLRAVATDTIYCIPIVDEQWKYDYYIARDNYATLFISAYDSTPSTTLLYSAQDSGACCLIDLTKAFPNDWQNINTIEDFQSRVATLGIDMNAYNEGEVIHCNTESIKSVGDNAWDEEWELGTISAAGADIISTNHIRAKNYLPIVGGEQYYFSCKAHVDDMYALVSFYDSEYNFISRSGMYSPTSNNNANYNNPSTAPSNARYAKFYLHQNYGTTYNHDICIRLAHTGYKTDYEPYWQDTLPLPIINKYFPDGMKLAGSAHDEIRFNKATKKWEYSKGKIKSVDMGTLSWNLYSGNFYSIFGAESDLKMDSILLCSAYNGITPQDLAYNDEDKAIWYQIISSDKTIVVRDTSYTDAASFKAMLQEKQVKLYYESNDWEWVELDEADQNFRDYYNVADFGTEMSQSEFPSAAFSADIIYQFNAVDMIREHEAEINELQSIIATMQAQLTSLTHNT